MKNCRKCGGSAGDSSRKNLCRICHNDRMREYRAKNIEKIRDIRRKSRKRVYQSSPRERLRTAANSSVKAWKRLKSNPLRPKPCEKCSEPKAEAHHDSYLKEHWRVIRWLCKDCHEEWHRLHGPKYPDGV